MRLGISSVRHIGDELAKRIDAGRPYDSMEDVVRRCGLTQPQVEALATAGAFGCFELDRREALWSAGAVAQSRADRLPGVVTGTAAPALPELTEVERTTADLWATGVTPDTYPTEFVRDELDRIGAVTATGLKDVEPGSKVIVGGIVTHRQRPATAQGTTFVNLEDETGLINIVVSKGAWAHYRRVARSSPALLVKGRLERSEGVINVVAERILPLSLRVTGVRSRDFR